MGNAFAWAFLGLGRAHAPAQQKLSVSRLENYDFAAWLILKVAEVDVSSCVFCGYVRLVCT